MQDKRVSFCVRTPLHLKCRVKARASLMGITVESLVSQILESYLDQQETISNDNEAQHPRTRAA